MGRIALVGDDRTVRATAAAVGSAGGEGGGIDLVWIKVGKKKRKNRRQSSIYYIKAQLKLSNKAQMD